MPLSADKFAACQCFLPIARSWERCKDLGLFRTNSACLDLLPRRELKRRKDQHIYLLHQAANELSVLRRAITGADGVVLLTDPSGTILNQCGDNSFLGKAQKLSLRPGATWSEVSEGTNAIGTALVEQGLVQIAGDQHFLEDNRFLICTAKPVMSPTGQVAGILDISGDIRNPPVHASMLVQLATARIEHSWVSLHGAQDLLTAFHPHPNWLGTPHEGLLVFRDEILVAANPTALRLLGLGTQAINKVRWSEIFCNHSSYGQVELYPRNQTGVFYGSVRPPQTVSVALPGRAESKTSEITIRDEAIWDTELIQMLTKARRAFEADIPILLQGETGTGKEVFVRALQRLSTRASAPFVPVNCAAIPEGLQEAEMFGYEEGAFTGARRQGSPGYVRRAEGGTLFLDEIGDTPLALQVQLLRVLQDGEVTPLGGRHSVHVKFRLVVSTNRDLQAAVADGSFRADLYYRLRHMVFCLPPLRKRHNLAGILDAMLASLGGEARGVRLTSAARQKLLDHSWPGNLRELSNLLSALLALAEDGSWIDIDSLPQDILVPQEAPPEQPQKLSDLTDQLLRKTIRENGGNVSAAARQLGLHRSTLYRHLSRS